MTSLTTPVPEDATHEWRALSEALLAHPAPCETAERPESWQPVRKVDEAARAACASCPAAGACLEYALAAREPEGMWGGLTPPERKDLAAHLRAEVSGVPAPGRHGDEVRYANGCRCVQCNHAHVLRIRRWRLSGQPRTVPTPP